MSIWCSWEHIGWSPGGEVLYANGRKAVETGGFDRGEVRTYASGFSNHHPDSTGSHELPASLGIDHAAPWCVPGHDQTEAIGYACSGCGEHHDVDCGPWLRLGIYADDSLSWWGPADERPKSEGPVSAQVVMDEAAVTALRDDLTAWLAKDKVRPLVEATP